MIKQRGNATIWVAVITTIGVIVVAIIQAGLFSHEDPKPQSNDKAIYDCLAKIKCEDNAMVKANACRETIEGMGLSKYDAANKIKEKCYKPMTDQIEVCWSTVSATQKQKYSAQCETLLNSKNVSY